MKALKFALFSLLSCFVSQLWANLPKPLEDNSISGCVTQLSKQQHGWCEVIRSKDHPSISSVWLPRKDKKVWMHSGPRSVLTTWNSAAFDATRNIMYFTGGGHANYGGNEVYQFDLSNSRWTRLTSPSPLEYLFVGRDYNKKGFKARKLCWAPTNRHVPPSAHTYDGLQFSKKTQTIFYFAMDAANGACFNDDKDEYRDSPLIQNKTRQQFAGWFEFNPDLKESRNGLEPLTWRKIFNYKQLIKMGIERGYPVTAELPNNDIVFGSRHKTVVYDPSTPTLSQVKPYTKQGSSGDGTFMYDKTRDYVWFINRNNLTAFDRTSGKKVKSLNANVPHGKSIAFNQEGHVVTWDGNSTILSINPDDKKPEWQRTYWGENGPMNSFGRVFGKWVYLAEEGLFAGISNDKTGFWLYKHGTNLKSATISNLDPQQLIDNAPAGSDLKIPEGTYGKGLFINKSLNIDLTGVSLLGVVKSKGIINTHCNDCTINIYNFSGNGNFADCLSNNCAGVKVEGKNFNVGIHDSHINNTVMGVLTDNRGGKLLIENTLIENTGLNDKSKQLGHSVYAGRIDELIFRNSTVRNTSGNGHLLKSRAPKTIIENSNLLGLNALHSRSIDFPCGGLLKVKNSTIVHGKNSDNNDVISVGTEKRACKGVIHPSRVVLAYNWIIIERTRADDERGKERGKTRLFTWKAPFNGLIAKENYIIEKTGDFNFDNTGDIDELSSSNKIYRSRAKANLKPDEIPLRTAP